MAALPAIWYFCTDDNLALGPSQTVADLQNVPLRRCVTQLLVVSLVLVPVFAFPTWWLVLTYAIIMTAVAAAEGVSQPRHAYQVCSWLCCSLLTSYSSCKPAPDVVVLHHA